MPQSTFALLVLHQLAVGADDVEVQLGVVGLGDEAVGHARQHQGLGLVVHGEGVVGVRPSGRAKRSGGKQGGDDTSIDAVLSHDCVPLDGEPPKNVTASMAALDDLLLE